MTTPLAVTMGEPAGIGPDLILSLYAQRDALGLPPFIVFGHAPFLRERARRLGLTVDIVESRAAESLSVFAKALPVHHIAGDVPDRPGDIVATSAAVVIETIASAVQSTLAGECRAIVTAPIHKGALYHAGFRHPGHTEYLAALCAHGDQPRLPVMMLAHEELRTVPLTIHVPLKDVPELVTSELVLETLCIVSHDLRRRFGVVSPKIGVAGLNPHAGEGGGIGREELDIIGPALDAARTEGLDIVGPLPADTLFYPPHWRSYDAVVAMYHDQALIPIKTVAFDSAVNVTLGLPLVRTSPDHGTAFDLAGTGKGSTRSFAAAIAMADRMTTKRP